MGNEIRRGSVLIGLSECNLIVVLQVVRRDRVVVWRLTEGGQVGRKYVSFFVNFHSYEVLR